MVTWSLLSKRTDDIPHDLVKSRSRQIGCYNDHITPHFVRYISNAAAEVPVEFRKCLKPEFRCFEPPKSCGETSVRLVKRSPTVLRNVTLRNTYKWMKVISWKQIKWTQSGICRCWLYRTKEPPTKRKLHATMRNELNAKTFCIHNRNYFRLVSM